MLFQKLQQAVINFQKMQETMEWYYFLKLIQQNQGRVARAPWGDLLQRVFFLYICKEPWKNHQPVCSCFLNEWQFEVSYAQF